MDIFPIDFWILSVLRECRVSSSGRNVPGVSPPEITSGGKSRAWVLGKWMKVEVVYDLGQCVGCSLRAES